MTARRATTTLKFTVALTESQMLCFQNCQGLFMAQVTFYYIYLCLSNLQID